MDRLQKVIAHSGFCSRRKAEEEITRGHVMVNGHVIKELGTKVSGTDEIVISGHKLNKAEDKEYILLNKPRGVVTTTSDDKDRKTVIDLIATDKRLYPVGRLDYDTTGALLLTNDGDLANLLMHPSNEVTKVYTAKIEGILTGDDIYKIEHGVKIDGSLVIPNKVKIRKIDKKKQTCLVEIIIHEGKNHEVKRIFEAMGYSVSKLKRDSFAGLSVAKMQSGEYKYLNPKEVKRLYSLAKK